MEERPKASEAQSITYREELPTWGEVIKLRRRIGELKATVEDLHDQIDGMRIDAENLEHKDAEISRLKQKVKLQATKIGDRAILLERIRQLEQENGELEAGIARALGRVVVVAKEDEVAHLAAALVQIRDFAAASLGPATGLDGEQPVIGDPGARLRQLRSVAQHALDRCKATEQQLDPKAVLKGGES